MNLITSRLCVAASSALLPVLVVLAGAPAHANDAILEAGVEIAGVPAGILDVALSDVDDDGDDDLILCGAEGLHWLDNGRDGTWTVRTLEVEGASVGACTTVEAIVGPAAGIGRVLPSSAGAFQQAGDGSWRRVSPAVDFVASAIGDADGDGRMELLYCGAESGVSPGGFATYLAEWSGDVETGAFVTSRELRRAGRPCVRIGVADLYDGEAPRAVLIRDLGSELDRDLETFIVDVPSGNGTPHSEVGGIAEFVVVDTDWDGDLDIVGAGREPPLFYQSDGTRAYRTSPALTGAANSRMTVADMNRDERIDIVAAASGGDIRKLSWNGSGWDTRVLRDDAPAGIVGVRAPDGDGDGDADLLVAHDGGVTYYPNLRVRSRGRWTQEGAVSLTGWDTPRVVPVDADGDGDDDLIVSNDGVGPIDLYEQGDDGVWTSRRLDANRNISGEGVAGDFDGDDDMDVVISGGSQIYWWRNNGDSAWTATNLRSIAPAVLDVGDIDADGDLDIVAAETDTGRVVLIANDGTGAFSQTDLPGFTAASHISLVDVDEDGDLDIGLGATWDGAARSGVAWIEQEGASWTNHTVWVSGRDGLNDVAFADFDRDGDVEAYGIVLGSGSGFNTVVDPPADPRNAWDEREYNGRGGFDQLRLEPRVDNDGRVEVLGWGDSAPTSLLYHPRGQIYMANVADVTAPSGDVAALRGRDGSFRLAVSRSDQLEIYARRITSFDMYVEGPDTDLRPAVDTATSWAPFVDLVPPNSTADTLARIATLGLVATLGGEPVPAVDLLEHTAWSGRIGRYDDVTGETTLGELVPLDATMTGTGVALSIPEVSTAGLGDDESGVWVDLHVSLDATWFDVDPSNLDFVIARDGTTAVAGGYDAAVTAIGRIETLAAGTLRVGNSGFSPGVLDIEVEALDSIDVDATSSTVDPDGDTLTVARVASDPLHGLLEVIDETTLRYTSLGEVAVEDAFVVTLTDGYDEVDVIGLVDVQPSTSPVALDSIIVVTSGVPRTFDLEGSDPDDPTVFELVDLPASGDVRLDDALTGQVTYTPDPGFAGTDSFTWSVRGGDETSRVATVTLQVRRPAPPDADGDGTPDVVDNCPDTPNPDQSNLDGDGEGDLCDDDDDGDGLPDLVDPCPLLNGDDADLDDDGLGDLCDDDDDGDEVPDDEDVCPRDDDPDQVDTDADLRGDVCDEDDDDDLVLDEDDNCPLIANRAQWDSDDDGAGDACDPDDDNDEVPDDEDVCPFTADPLQTDTDEDGVGNACDGDQDGDGALTEEDCDDLDPSVRGIATWYADLDEDGYGDPDVTIEECAAAPPAMYADNPDDNCPDVANEEQIDSDEDGIGDACDDDPGDPAPDAGGDAGADAGSDAGSDAGGDAGSDAGPDAGGDASGDAGSDAGQDGGSDAGDDAAADAGTDAASDTASDTGQADAGGSADGGEGETDGGEGEADGGSKDGCAAAGATPSATWLLFGLALWARQRRRRAALPG